MQRFFASTGRFTVRFRWAVVGTWVAATVLASLFLPSLTSVARQSNTDLQPASSPSLHAARLATPFQGPDQTPVSVVLARGTGTVTAADLTAIGRLTASLAKVTGVQQVRDLGGSPDHKAVQLEVLAGLNLATPGPAQRLVTGLRQAIAASALPRGLHASLAGPVAAQADASQADQKAVSLGQDLTIAFIVTLLLVVFRSLLAPLLTLAPAVLVTQLAGPVIGAASKAGLQVSSLTQILLLILTLGAGTDYGLFLVFRVREELRAGRAPHDAVSCALARVGESVTFSAATVIAALLTLLLATFGLYSSLRALLQPGRPAGHRDRAHAAGCPHPAAGAAGHLRPGRVLALPHGPRHRAPRLVGTHRGPRRRPPSRDARRGASRLRRAGHGRARLPAGRTGQHPGRSPRLGLRRGQRSARRPFPGRRQQPDHGAAAVPQAGLERPGAGRRRAATARRAA
jgi:predicted RND superfamily exporter protein